jgi:hypothetical protein
MKRFAKMAMAIATMVGSGLIVSGTAFAATPDMAACTFGSSSNNVKTCISFTSQVTAEAIVVNSARKLLVCVERPNGAQLMCTLNGRYQTVAPGNSIRVSWPPTGTAPTATYCAVTRRMNADGTNTVIGDICAPN